MAEFSLPPEISVGPVVLRVRAASDLATFYQEIIGLKSEQQHDTIQLSTTDSDPLLILHEDPTAPERHPSAAGLYHFALRVPDRPALAAALNRIQTTGYQLDGAADHVASEAIYLTDPEGNGIEIYTDRPRETWEYTSDNEVRLPGNSLDLSALLTHAPNQPTTEIHPATDMGHVHLEVTDLPRSTQFYHDQLGTNLRRRKPNAVFLAGGNYHHHLAINTRQGRTTPYRHASLGLDRIEFQIPHQTLSTLTDHLTNTPTTVSPHENGIIVTDPDGIPVSLQPTT